MVIFSFGFGLCETHLSGNIGGMTLDKAGNPYIISDNIIVQRKTTSIIKAGCVFLFNNFTGMIVDGDLSVEGTPADPIVFTTVNDSNYFEKPKQLANPFDWNGILITRNAAKVRMSNFILAYSIYGIKSEKEEFSIENGIFRANGQYHLTVRESIKPVNDNYPFSYGIAPTQDSTLQNPTIKSEVQSSKASEKSTGNKKHAMVFGRNLAPILIGTAGIVSGVVCGVSANCFFDTRAKYSAEKSARIRDDLKTKGNNQLATSLVTGGIAVVAIPTAIVLFLRDNRRSGSAKKVTLTPYIACEISGALLSVEF